MIYILKACIERRCFYNDVFKHKFRDYVKMNKYIIIGLFVNYFKNVIKYFSIMLFSIYFYCVKIA